MKKLGLVVLMVVAVSLPFFAHAAISATRTQQSFSMTTSKGNTYEAGGTVDVADQTSGDLVVGGGTVVVTGSVGQDLLAAAGNLTVAGKVGDDARIAGGNVFINAPVMGELVAGAGSLNIGASTVIGQDLVAGGGTIIMGGTVNGNTKIGGGNVTISGTLNKDADIRANSLVISKTAVINGAINYTGPSEPQVEAGAQVKGTINYTRGLAQQNRYNAGVFLFGLWFFRLAIMLVTALVIFFIFRRFMPVFAANTVSSFWREVLRGLVILIVVPVVVILLFITLVGAFLGLILGALYLFSILFAGALVGILMGELIHRWTVKTEERKLAWYMVIAGVIVADLLLFIPVVGWIIDAIFFLAAFGAFINLLYRRAKEWQTG